MRHNKSLLLPLVFFAVTTPLPAQQDPANFAPVINYDSGGVAAYSVAAGDINSDGNLDLVVANLCARNTACTGSGSVSVLLGNGDGTFQQAAAYGSGGYKAVSVAIADVNGDGIPDLVTSNLCVSPVDCSSGNVGVLLGVGDGTFQPAVSYSAGGSSQGSATLGSVAVADVNGDGTPDLVVINQCRSSIDCRGTVGLLLGNGDATFQPAAIFGSGGLFATSMVIADVNGDSKPDIMVANRCAISGSVCPATSNGSVGVLINISTPFKAFVQPPIDADGSSVFNAGRGVVPVKFTLSRNGVPTCTLPPAAIGVTRTVGATLGLVEESTYLMNADSSSNFRIDPGACQYISNLATSQLGVGNYQVDINIGGIVVGNAVFALQ